MLFLVGMDISAWNQSSFKGGHFPNVSPELNPFSRIDRRKEPLKLCKYTNWLLMNLCTTHHFFKTIPILFI